MSSSWLNMQYDWHEHLQEWEEDLKRRSNWFRLPKRRR